MLLPSIQRGQDIVVFLYSLWKPNFSQNPRLSRHIGFVDKLNTPGFQLYKTSVGESRWLIGSYTSLVMLCATLAMRLCNGLLVSTISLPLYEVDIIMKTTEARRSY